MKDIDKVLVLGIDGGCYQLFKKLGMRFVEILEEEGSVGFLVNSSMDDRGWATLLTGKDASWHGGFYRIPNKRCYTVFPSFGSKDYKCEPIWTELNRCGVKQGYLGVPTTYPPQKVRGFFVSAGGGGKFPKPDECAYPVNFMIENQELFNNYIHDCRVHMYIDKPPRKYIEDLSKAVKIRCRVATELLNKYNPDFFMTVFVGPDRLQHRFWDHIVSSEKSKNDPILKSIKEYYLALDEGLVSLLEKLKEDRNIFIVSDHGFCKLQQHISLNRLLVDLGFAEAKILSLRKTVTNWGRRYLPVKIQSTVKSAIRKRERASGCPIFSPELVWEKTYAFGNMTNGVFINRQNEYPDGIVDSAQYEALRSKIMLALESVKDPTTGTRLFETVMKREERYKGPAKVLAPDIILDIPEGYEITNRIEKEIVIKPPKTLFTRTGFPLGISGIHARNGFFGALGPLVGRGSHQRIEENNSCFNSLIKTILIKDVEECGNLNSILVRRI